MHRLITPGKDFGPPSKSRGKPLKGDKMQFAALFRDHLNCCMDAELKGDRVEARTMWLLQLAIDDSGPDKGQQ